MKKLFVSMLAGLIVMTNLASSAFAANNGSITRADFAVMVVKSLPEIDRAALNQAGDCYDDIDGLRQEKFICYLVEQGVFSDGGGQFRPNATLTRAVTAAILTNAFDFVDPNPDLSSLYSDVENGTWYKGYFNNLAVYGIPEPEVMPCGEIDPSGTLTYKVARAWTLRARSAEAAELESCSAIGVLNLAESISLEEGIAGGTTGVELAKFKFSAQESDIFVQEFAMNFAYDDNDMPLNNLVLKNSQGELVAVPVAVGIDEIVFEMNDLIIEEGNGEILKLFADVPVIAGDVEVSLSINEDSVVAENADADPVGIEGAFPIEMNFSLIATARVNIWPTQDNLPARVVVAGSQDVELLKFEMSTEGEDVMLRDLGVNIGGSYDLQDIERVELVDNVGNVLSSRILIEEGEVNFNIEEGYLIEDGGRSILAVRVDFSDLAALASTVNAAILENEDVELLGVESGAVVNPAVGGYPIRGNDVQINGREFEIGTARVSKTSARWELSSVGQENVELLAFQIAAEEEDMALREIAFNVRQMPLTELRLVSGEQVLATAVPAAGGELVFSFIEENDFDIFEGETANFQLVGDLQVGANYGWQRVTLDAMELIGDVSEEIVEVDGSFPFSKWIYVGR